MVLSAGTLNARSALFLSMSFMACRFEFPLELDMWKYTVEGLAERDASAEAAAASAGRADAPAPGEAGAPRPGTPKAGAHGMQYMYQLKGVVVHSGTANVGHYYSYIKVRQCSSLPLRSEHRAPFLASPSLRSYQPAARFCQYIPRSWQLSRHLTLDCGGV